MVKHANTPASAVKPAQSPEVEQAAAPAVESPAPTTPELSPEVKAAVAKYAAVMNKRKDMDQYKIDAAIRKYTERMILQMDQMRAA